MKHETGTSITAIRYETINAVEGHFVPKVRTSWLLASAESSSRAEANSG